MQGVCRCVERGLCETVVLRTVPVFLHTFAYYAYFLEQVLCIEREGVVVVVVGGGGGGAKEELQKCSKCLTFRGRILKGEGCANLDSL